MGLTRRGRPLKARCPAASPMRRPWRSRERASCHAVGQGHEQIDPAVSTAPSCWWRSGAGTRWCSVTIAARSGADGRRGAKAERRRDPGPSRPRTLEDIEEVVGGGPRRGTCSPQVPSGRSSWCVPGRHRRVAPRLPDAKQGLRLLSLWQGEPPPLSPRGVDHQGWSVPQHHLGRSVPGGLQL